MLNQITSFFISAFYFQGTNWISILLAITLGLVFGSLWLAFYRPQLFWKRSLWIIAGVSAILTWTAVAFIQIPLQSWTGQAIFHIWSESTLSTWILLAAIPQILLSGIVQEAAKLAPVLFFWWRSKRNFTPQFGLIAGAVSGAGFGIFEAIWVHNQIFASGWNLHLIGAEGFSSLWGFWERFFSIAFHISASALVGYGLAKHKGWQFYLLVSLLHGVMNYSIVLLQTNKLTVIQDEIVTAIFAVALTVVLLWLRWHKTKEIPVNNSPTLDIVP